MIDPLAEILGRDSYSIGHEFESRHLIQDDPFLSYLISPFKKFLILTATDVTK